MSYKQKLFFNLDRRRYFFRAFLIILFLAFLLPSLFAFSIPVDAIDVSDDKYFVAVHQELTKAKNPYPALIKTRLS